MLTAHNISKSLNLNQILNNISFSIHPTDRIGLIGPNGCGKSTLLKILTHQLEPDEGNIALNPPDLKIGYLPQAYQYPEKIVTSELILELISGPDFLEAKLKKLAYELTLRPDHATVQDEFDQVLEKLERYQPPRIHPQEILDILKLNDIPDDLLVAQLSGGQKTRLGLAKILIDDPDLLILDEPTNHLDIAMLEWIEEWVQNFQGGVLLVSHDRTFLNNTVNIIFDLDPVKHTIMQYQGNYDQYLGQFMNQQDKMLAAYRDQVYEIRKMKQDIAKTKNQAYQVEITTTSRQPGVRRYAKKVARKALSREKKLERYIQSEDRIEKPKHSWQMKVEFQERKHHSQQVVRIENLSAGYIGFTPLIRDFSASISYGERIALTGPNGSGKTTILRTISGQIEPISGSVHIGKNIQLGYLTQEQEFLDDDLNALDIILQTANLSETDARAFLHQFLFTGDDVFIPVKDLSYGERSRLQLSVLIVQGCDFLLLDEPINHLDIPSRTQFEKALSEYNGTVLAVVHDRYFIQRFADALWILDESGSLTQNPTDDMSSINHVPQTRT